MSLLVRKIIKTKWLQNNITSDEDVSADAITNCLKTSGNTLSVWKVSTETDIKEAILAIISSGDHLEAIDIITMNCQTLTSDGIDYIQNPDNSLSRVKDLKNSHYDIVDLSYKKLGLISQYIVQSFKNGQVTNSCNERQVVRYTVGYLKGIIQEAISNGRLNKEDLPDSFQEKLA